MRYIDKINNNPDQQYTLLSEDGDSISMALKYMPTQGAWKANFALGDFVLNGITLVCGANILRTFKNNITFGISVKSDDGLDPTFLNDFSSKRVKLYLLNAADVLAIEAAVFDA